MTKKRKITDDELKSIFDYYVSNSASQYNDELASQRELSMQYYYGQPMGNEVPGRSQVVSHDVFEVVEWTLPSMLRVFLSGEHVAKFNPSGPSDDDEAKQATDYCNHVFLEQNEGFAILYDMFKDGLLQKTGVVKTYWDDTPEYRHEEYTGLKEAEYNNLLMDEDIEVEEESAYAATDVGTEQALGLDGPVVYYDCKVRRTISDGHIQIDNVPPEEHVVIRRARSLQDAEAQFHRLKKSVCELKQMFPDVKESFWEEVSSEDDQEFNQEYLARHADIDNANDDAFANELLGKKIWYTEGYFRIDWDGDDYAELRKITRIANEIVENIEVEEHPFSSVCPIPVPHKYYGISLADATGDLQKTKTAILRNILDNIYLTNNTRMGVLEGQVNLDDALTSRPGGLVRMKTRDALFPLVTQPLPQGTFDLLEYVDRIRDGRTGITKFNTGLNEASLNHAKAGPMVQQMNASVVRLEMVARIFADYRGGVRDIFDKIYRLAKRHVKRAETIKVRGEWVEIDPSEWKGRCNVKVKVGLGHGNAEQDLAQLSMIADRVAQLRNDPEFKNMVQPENIFNFFAEALRSVGRKNIQDFITHPSQAKPAEPQQDPKAAAEQIKAQAAIQREQMQMEQDKIKAQMEQQKMQFDAQMQMEKQSFEREKWEHERQMQMLEMRQDEMEAQLKMAELSVEAAQDRPVKVGND